MTVVEVELSNEPKTFGLVRDAVHEISGTPNDPYGDKECRTRTIITADSEDHRSVVIFMHVWDTNACEWIEFASQVVYCYELRAALDAAVRMKEANE
jgi:hypothetical protein